ncbi:MAG: TlpA family protein disulfide reductase [Muribaculaceae bacterium]|nr:TlpA family protein disulfide reductase [Muribaculaceae bacterium]
MKKQLMLLGALLGGTLISQAGVKVAVAPELGLDSLRVQGVLFSELLTATRQNPPKVSQSIYEIADGRSEFALPLSEAANYQILLNNQNGVDFYATPGDNLEIELRGDGSYNITGTRLMEDLNEFRGLLAPIDASYEALMASGKADRESVMALAAQYENVAKDFYASHKDSPAAAYALLEVEGEDFLNLVPTMSEEARKSIFYPMVEQKEKGVRAQLEKEKMRNELSSGNVEAPDFKLPDLEGKMVSISDFRGKWIVLDFWGAWCKWCIKGFPALKEAYEKYKGELEVIGIDNRDTPEEWKAAVARFKLPWINLYNAGNDESGILAAYLVEGFPTKAIINPEGKVVDITVGEDPEFFVRLASLMGK